jgi:hypothetical protein
VLGHWKRKGRLTEAGWQGLDSAGSIGHRIRRDFARGHGLDPSNSPSLSPTCLNSPPGT